MKEFLKHFSFLRRESLLVFFATISVLSMSISKGSAQIIDNRSGNAFKDEMFFSQQFLWLNKIKSMTGVVSVKRPNRPIEQRPDVTVYRFNEVGLLHQLDKVSSVLNLVDSLTIEYRRNDLGEVKLREEAGTRGYFTTSFNYNEHGKLVRMDYGTAENIATDKGKLIPGREIAVNSESFSWTDQGNGIVTKSVYNNYGLHYSNWTITKNAHGFIESEVEELMMSGRITTRRYAYNEHGWISGIETGDNLSNSTKRQSFIYDQLGNLLKVEFFDGRSMTREVEVLYTPTMLVEAFLDHDLQTHDIFIVKFSYEFYK